jgi:hypothetical protein
LTPTNTIISIEALHARRRISGVRANPMQEQTAQAMPNPGIALIASWSNPASAAKWRPRAT